MQNLDVCPVKYAGALDTKFRKIFQNPQKLLFPYVQAGMTVLDMGCGPGFFTVEIAGLVGDQGIVIAADLQQGMLDIVLKKVSGTELEKRVRVHKCGMDKIGLEEKVDFINAIYMIHEIKNKRAFFEEACSLLKPGGVMYILEPKFHVPKDVITSYSSELSRNGMEIVFQKKSFFEMNLIAKKN